MNAQSTPVQNTEEPRPLLTVICPVYNEETVIPLFFGRIRTVFEAISQRYRCELVFINNASNDRTLDAILRIRDGHPDVYVITLSRTGNYQRSVDCGLRSTSGDLFLVIDVDCEDPPEMIPGMLERQAEGYDVVYGERVNRHEGELMTATRKLFYRITRLVADEEIILDMAEFALLTDEVRVAIIQDTSSAPFIRASIGRVGFRRIGIPYKREPRVAGRTHYNLIGMTKFAIGGILSSSTLLLRMPAYTFPLWVAAMAALATAAAHGRATAFPWLVTLASIYIGGTCAAIAIYVARAYKNTLGRPNFIIDRKRTIMRDRAPVIDRTLPR